MFLYDRIKLLYNFLKVSPRCLLPLIVGLAVNPLLIYLRSQYY